jgi:hypothetical protein
VLVQLIGDITWHTFYMFGSVILIGLDATVIISRRIKLAMCLFWIVNSLRLFYFLLFVYPYRSYTQRLSFCVPLVAHGSLKLGPFDGLLDPADADNYECFSLMVVRLQSAVSLFLFVLKHTHSLFFHPRALIILRATISFRWQPHPQPQP